MYLHPDTSDGRFSNRQASNPRLISPLTDLTDLTVVTLLFDATGRDAYPPGTVFNIFKITVVAVKNNKPDTLDVWLWGQARKPVEPKIVARRGVEPLLPA